ncbi:MAG: GNAT family N-acetyltransferase [Flavobacteriales bacterium]|nr:GNAT family N-acetyltransferase [Flavobacteriales bacterium]
MKQTIIWQAKDFKELSVDEYFEILFLRSEVFVLEQVCPYQDVDSKEPHAIHLFGTNEAGLVVAVMRILPRGVSYEEVSLGRLAVKKEYRQQGIGNALMVEALKVIQSKLGDQSVRISAQQYLKNYYKKHGFKQVGVMYLEDDQPHIEMIKENS